jgi:hypothetical protein
MKTLYDSQIVPSIKHGVKILSGGLKTLSELSIPLHLEMSDFSEQVKQVTTTKTKIQ